MPSFEEEAFARAQQMNKRRPFYTDNQQSKKATGKDEHPTKEEPKPVAEKMPEKAIQNNVSLLDMLFKNKEQSLILLLLVLLMDENADPTLLLALIYLLI